MPLLLLYLASMRTILTVLLLSGAALASCQKDDSNDCPAGCTTLQGQFFTGNGQEPLRKLPLTVVWFKSYGFFGRVGSRTKSVGSTDNDGRYTLRYSLSDEELNTGHLDVDIGKAQYYGLSSAYLHAPQKRDTTATQPTYWLPRPATLTCNLLNPNDMQATDRISVDISFKPGAHRTGIQGSVGGFASPAQGGGTTQSFEVPAEQLLRIKVLRFRGPSYVPLSVTRDSLLLGRNETRAYAVRF
jgi:hypothetical protein